MYQIQPLRYMMIKILEFSWLDIQKSSNVFIRSGWTEGQYHQKIFRLKSFKGCVICEIYLTPSYLMAIYFFMGSMYIRVNTVMCTGWQYIITTIRFYKLFSPFHICSSSCPHFIYLKQCSFWCLYVRSLQLMTKLMARSFSKYFR